MVTVRPVRHLTGALILSAVLGLTAGCGGKEPAPAASAPGAAPTAPADASQAAQPPAPLQATTAVWTPEALEELLAPVALYPDPVLIQVLTAATNPQEVLDAGNWLIANPSLSGDALDEAAQQAGFTPPARGLIQSPQVVDQMCLNLGWTEELGQAYVNDQAGVMDAVQRLRAQAQEVGTLTSSDKMKVETVPPPEPSQPQVITISPPSPQVVYVPQYDPVAAYAPPATTTVEDKGHSTGAMVATGVLAFGAGILVGEIFDDDDDDYWNDRYYGNMWYRPMPYYPPYPYRPAYGGGFYPSYGYNRPPNYVRGGNNVVIVNQNNNYWNRYDDDRDIEVNRRQAQSPISAAKPNRNDLTRLNADAAKGPKRAAPAASDAWQGKSGYAGADPAKREAIESRTDAAKAKAPGAAPKVQGTYAGAKPSPDRVDAAKASAGSSRPTAVPATKPAPVAKPAAAAKPAAVAKPAVASMAKDVDRGRVADAAQNRPAPTTAAKPAARPAPADRTAVSGANRGAADKAASARGRESAPKGVPPQAKQRAGDAGAAKRNR
jgi:hypothetical protein